MYLSQKVTRFVSGQRSAAFKSVPIHSYSLKRIFSIGQQICKIITCFSVRNGNNITWEDGGAYSVSDKNIFSTCRASLQPTTSIHLSVCVSSAETIVFFRIVPFVFFLFLSPGNISRRDDWSINIFYLSSSIQVLRCAIGAKQTSIIKMDIQLCGRME